MSHARKQIHYYGMKPAKSLQRLVQRQIEKWIAREQSISLLHESSYWARFEKEPEQPLIFCHLRIQIGSQTWERHDCGKTVQDALFHALKHLSQGSIPSSEGHGIVHHSQAVDKKFLRAIS